MTRREILQSLTPEQLQQFTYPTRAEYLEYLKAQQAQPAQQALPPPPPLQPPIPPWRQLAAEAAGLAAFTAPIALAGPAGVPFGGAAYPFAKAMVAGTPTKQAIHEALPSTLSAVPFMRPTALLPWITSGAVYPLAESLTNPKPLPTTLAESAVGGALGGALGGAFAGAPYALRPRETLLRGVRQIGKIPVPGKYRTNLAELFQPAVERLPFMPQQAVRRMEAATSLGQAAAARAANAVEGLPLEAKAVVRNLFRRGEMTPDVTQLPPETRTQVTEALRPLGEFLSITAPRTEQQQFIRDFTLKDSLIKLFAKAPEIGSEMVKEVNDLASQQKPLSVSQAYKVLFKAIDHPNASPETKIAARSLINLAADTSEDLLRAIGKSELELMKSKIRWTPGWHSPVPKPGFVPSKIAGLKGLYLPKDLELSMQDFTYTPGLAHTWYNKFFLSPWKMGKIVIRVPTHFRNIIGNVILNDWGGMSVLRPQTYLTYARALQELKRNGPIAQEFTKLTGYDTTFAGVETSRVFGHIRVRAGEDIVGLSDRMLDAVDRHVRTTGAYRSGEQAASGMSKLYQAEEMWAKLAKYMWNRRQGMTPQLAAADAVKWTFNYGEVTPIVKQARTSFMPFATWQAKSLPLFVETLIKHPLRVGKWMLLPMYITSYALDKVGLTPEEWKDLRSKLPDYLKKGIISVLPWRDEQGRLQLSNWTWMLPGWGDFAEQMAGGLFSLKPMELARTVIQNPFVNIAADLLRNTTFTGQPIYHEWEKPATKFLKTLGHTYLQLSPGMIGMDPYGLYKTLTQQERALTPSQQFLGQFGVRIHPYQESEIRRMGTARVLRQQREVRREMRRELRGATTPDERQEIVEKYMDYLP